jgi:hypothetical protein
VTDRAPAWTSCGRCCPVVGSWEDRRSTPASGAGSCTPTTRLNGLASESGRASWRCLPRQGSRSPARWRCGCPHSHGPHAGPTRHQHPSRPRAGTTAPVRRRWDGHRMTWDDGPKSYRPSVGRGRVLVTNCDPTRRCRQLAAGLRAKVREPRAATIRRCASLFSPHS